MCVYGANKDCLYLIDLSIQVDFGICGFSIIGFKIIKWGWWSDNFFVNMPDSDSIIMLVSLQKRVSTRAPLVSVHLVGRVNLGR